MQVRAAEPPATFQRLWRPRSLCFMLPLEAGEHLAVVGWAPDIPNSARKAGVSATSVLTEKVAARADAPEAGVVVTDGGSIPLADGSCDHVLVPRLTLALSRLVPDEVARVLRPGGSVFFGAQWSARARRFPAAWSIRGGRRRLERAGFEAVRVYAVGPSLAQPRHLVPVDAPNAVRWYAKEIYMPRSRKGALAYKVLRHAPGRLGLVLFPALGFVGRRRAERAGGT